VIGHAVLSSQIENFVNVFNSVTSPPVLWYHCALNYFLTMSVGFHLNLTFGFKSEVGGIKIVSMIAIAGWHFLLVIIAIDMLFPILVIFIGLNCSCRGTL